MATKKTIPREEVISLFDAAVRHLTKNPRRVFSKASAAWAAFMALSPSDRDWVLRQDVKAAAFFIGMATGRAADLLRYLEQEQ